LKGLGIMGFERIKDNYDGVAKYHVIIDFKLYLFHDRRVKFG